MSSDFSQEIQEHRRRVEEAFRQRSSSVVVLSEDKVKKLQDLNNKFTKKHKKGWKTLWEDIQTFHCSSKIVKLKDLELAVKKDLKAKYGDEEGERKAEEILKKLYTTDEELKTNRSEMAEINVEEAINEIMKGSPGLMIRGLKGKFSDNPKHRRFAHLTEMLGDVAPCTDGAHEHQTGCYQFETDLILLYPGENDILNVVIFEVKRPENKEHFNRNLVIDAIKQLGKDHQLVLNLLPDVTSDKLNIRTIIALPETENDDLFSGDVSRDVISKDDLVLGPSHLANKLGIVHSSVDPEQNQNFISLCARLWPETGKKLVDYKDEHKYVIRYEDDVAKQLLLFNEDQRNILNNLDEEENQQIKNFALCGGSGTGKTIMGLEIVKKLIKAYEKKKVKRVHVYAVTHLAKKSTEDCPLLKEINDQLKGVSSVANINVLTASELSGKLGISKEERAGFTVSSGSYGYGYSNMPKLIQYDCDKMKEKHPDEPVIFFNDEIMVFGNDASQDWRNIKPPGCDEDCTDPPKIVNLVMCFNPGTIGIGHEDGTKRMRFSTDYHIQNSDTDEVVYLPSHESFFVTHMKLRYRNTKKIQTLTKFIGDDMGIYLESDETPAPCLVGRMPTWIDFGKCPNLGLNQFQTAIDKMMKETDTFIQRVELFCMITTCHKKSKTSSRVREARIWIATVKTTTEAENATLFCTLALGDWRHFQEQSSCFPSSLSAMIPSKKPEKGSKESTNLARTKIWYGRYKKSLQKAFDQNYIWKL